jgi:peptidoglycan/xylan/chitin deacetylase (PgdA/CDA1 family)
LDVVGPFKKIAPSIHILNGHVIGINPEHDKDDFRRMLQELSHSAKLVRIEKACELIRRGERVSEPMIAFTFDDGFIDCYTGIGPILEEFGVNALFFINPNFINGDQNYIHNFLETKVPEIIGRPPMTVDMVRDLVRRGFVIGAHTMDHVRLTSDDAFFLQCQVADCKAAVEVISGQACEFFAWTYGRYSDISDKALAVALSNYKYVFSGDRYANYTCCDGRVFNRRHFECDWPASHVKYFLSAQRHY